MHESFYWNFHSPSCLWLLIQRATYYSLFLIPLPLRLLTSRRKPLRCPWVFLRRNVSFAVVALAFAYVAT